MIKYFTPVVNSAVIPPHPSVIPAPRKVIPAQAGIHKAVQDLTASRFRLQAYRNEVTEGLMTKLGMTRLGRGLQAGFTLLEIVLVLFLLALMASATLMLTENIEDQAKYNETKHRMEMMRKAIVGDPSRTINGGPEISGFVADVGRLPECVRELIEQKDCTEPANILTAWNIDVSTGISSGWRGPYIQVLAERTGDLRFRDAYGNTDSSTAVDAQYSGWIYDVSVAEISLTSNGFDRLDATDDIVAEPLIVASDWQINTININFINQNTSDALPTVNQELLLRVYLSNSQFNDGDDIGATGSLTFDVSSAAPANGGTSLKTFVFNTLTAIPTIGQRAYAVVCYDVPTGSTADSYVLFDGDCDNPGNAPPSSTDIQYFTATPRQTITLDWIIQ